MTGKAFGFWDRIKLNGIGSPRMTIVKASDNISHYINPGESTNYTNIELRPKGIIVHLKKRAQTYGWIIRFQDLSINDSLSKLSDHEHSIELENPSHSSTSFVKKIKTQKHFSEKER